MSTAAGTGGLIGVVLLATTALAAAGEARVIATAHPVAAVHPAGRGVLVETVAGRFFSAGPCSGAWLCLDETPDRPAARPAPAGGLPDGGVAKAGTGDVRRAWYTRPTGRYAHAVLGDAIEAGGLMVEEPDGTRHELVLDAAHVFEDLTPRIADLDGDGRNEIVAIRSSLTAGATVAIYGLRHGTLRLLDAAPEIGRANRWLNVAAIADLFGIGRPVVAWVDTPHIGGTLRFATFEDDRLALRPETVAGVSNHAIGSRELSLSVVADLDGDGTSDIALPSADRAGLVVATRSGRQTTPLPGRVSSALGLVGRTIVAATEDGLLLAIRP